MDKTITKAYAISDAKIQFVSLVGKAANKRKFVITKSETEPDKASFTTIGRIVKTDADTHYVTGVVYEPMKADTDNNYMTEAEIVKAAHWFMKNAGNVDLQHNFEKLEGASVVESWITKADTEINGEKISKGTWMMTVEVNEDTYDKVQKGELTGFSMGGVGAYSVTDDDISAPVTKAEGEKFGILKSFAEFLGLGSVMKGEVKDKYEIETRSSNFWTAFRVLESCLYRYNRFGDDYVFDDDEESIRAKLADFNNIITELLTKGNVKETLEKSAKEKGDMSMMSRDDIQSMIDEAIAKAVKPSTNEQPVAKEAAPAEITEDTIKKMVADAVAAAVPVQKAVKEAEQEDKPLTMDSVKDIVTKAVADAMEPVLKSTGIPSNLNGEGEQVKKSEGHFMDDIFGF